VRFSERVRSSVLIALFASLELRRDFALKSRLAVQRDSRPSGQQSWASFQPELFLTPAGILAVEREEPRGFFPAPPRRCKRMQVNVWPMTESSDNASALGKF
jgi:hypothetical protein